MSDLKQKRRAVRQRLIEENEFPHIPEDWGVAGEPATPDDLSGSNHINIERYSITFPAKAPTKAAASRR